MGAAPGSKGDPIDRDLWVRSLPALALVALAILLPIEIHAEAAVASALLLVLTALLLGRLPGSLEIARRGWPLAAYLVPLLGLDLVLTCNRHESALVLARWVLLLVAAIGLASAARQGAVTTLARLGALAGLAASLVALWQGLAGFSRRAAQIAAQQDPLSEALLARLRSGRVNGPFLLPSSLGGALAVTMPLSLVLLASSRRTRARVLHGASLLIQAAALTWTFSLGAVASLSGAALLVLGPRLLRRSGARGRRVLAAGAILAVVLLAGGLLVRRSLLPRPGPEDRPLAYRMGNWIVAGRIIGDHPWFGTGLGTFGNVFPAYRREGMNESRYAHCSWLQLPAEMGIGVLPILLLVPLGGELLRRKGARGDPFEAAGAIGALAFLIQNSADFTLYQPSIGALFVLAVAIASGRGAGCSEGSRNGRGGLPWITAGGALGVASMAAGGVLLCSGMSDLAREEALAVHGADAGRELRSLEAAARLDPLDPEAHGDLATALSGPGATSTELDRATSEARRAVALDPRTPFRHSDLARLLLRRGEPAEAWTELAKAAALYPLKPEYARDLAVLESHLFQDGP